MIKKPNVTVRPSALVLMVLMAATRFHHFGTSFALPDASLAVFFLAGLWLGGRYLFAILLLEAGLIDYLAITEMAVSDFCISPAYVFLIPTYAAMWLGGKWCRGQEILTFTSTIYQFTALVISTSTAFLLSNGSFFLLSEKNTDSSWQHFVTGLELYFPPYLSSTLIYVVSLFAVVTIAKSLQWDKTSKQTI